MLPSLPTTRAPTEMKPAAMITAATPYFTQPSNMSAYLSMPVGAFAQTLLIASTIIAGVLSIDAVRKARQGRAREAR